MPRTYEALTNACSDAFLPNHTSMCDARLMQTAPTPVAEGAAAQSRDEGLCFEADGSRLSFGGELTGFEKQFFACPNEREPADSEPLGEEDKPQTYLAPAPGILERRRHFQRLVGALVGALALFAVAAIAIGAARSGHEAQPTSVDAADQDPRVAQVTPPSR